MNDDFFINKDLETYRIVHYLLKTRAQSLDEIILSRFTGVNARIYDRIRNPKNFIGNIQVPSKKIVSLDDAIADSAKQIKAQCNGRRVYLLWSGGIDSTLAFYALVNEHIPFTVLYDENSIEEYPELAEGIFNGKFDGVDYKFMYEILDLTKDNNNFFITGEIGDQCMGSMVTMQFDYEQRNMLLSDAIACDLFKQVYMSVGRRDNRLEFQTSSLGERNATDIIVNFVYDTMTKFLGTTKETTTVAEFLWYLNFVHKYMIVIYRLHSLGLYGYGKIKNTYHFFDTEKFQQYAMSHYKENCAYIKETDYKLPFKEWIYKQDGNLDYLENKLKIPSLKASRYAGNGERGELTTV